MKLKCTGCGKVSTADDGWLERYADDLGFRRHRPCPLGGIWDSAEPISPAPAEPAKAAGWKAGDRFTVSGTVMADHGSGVSVSIDGEDGLRSFMGVEMAALRPEAAPPAAAPAGKCMSCALGMADANDRGLRMQLADARSERDKFEASACKKELELGDKEREIARLRSALRDATAKWQRRGGI